jgi:photosystem II stability/assembly factor-like uncharacterized protein
MKRLFFYSILLLANTAIAQSWTTVSSTLSVNYYSCSFGSATTVYIAGDSLINTKGIIMKSVDAGLTFYPINSSAFSTTGTELQSVYFTSADTGFVGGGLYTPTSPPSYGNGFIYRTVDGGANWTPVLTNVPAIFNSICFYSNNIGYATASSPGCHAVVYKTINGGITWSSIYTDPTTATTLYNIALTDDNTGYISGQDGSNLAFIIKIAAGAISGPTSYSTYNYFRGVHFISPSTGFMLAAANSSSPTFYILKTTDAGTTWNIVYSSSGYNYESCMQFDGVNGFAVGGNALITTDGGTTWTSMGSVTSASGSFYDMKIGNHTRLIVGEYGLVLRQGSPIEVQEVGIYNQSISLTPNPTHGDALLSFKECQKNTKVNVVDVTGRLLNQFVVNGYDLTIKTTDMHVGMYAVNVSDANGTTNFKLVVE